MAIHGLLRSALLFYLKLVIDSKNNNFIINPYEPCVQNKLVKVKAMTGVWHVDDLKVLHKDPFEVTKFSQNLSKIYGNKLEVHRGKIYDYIGMGLDYSETRVVKFPMIK